MHEGKPGAGAHSQVKIDLNRRLVTVKPTPPSCTNHPPPVHTTLERPLLPTLSAWLAAAWYIAQLLQGKQGWGRGTQNSHIHT